ncbi:hypothetical protein [Cohnella candidum]|uniref:Uncharacterized protein n=1 Tax=Cohnella candidum TaxID=2674991 RepID=A0A3G3K1G1_9BACL|nr:hypothetical protein [Cohnella candidum]AYQ73887.1 hypothetical protein EAV92_15660 [Cohnella candidum]
MKGLTRGDFEERIGCWLARSGSAASVVVEERFPGRRLVGGKYNPVSHQVTLYRETIREQCLQLFGTDAYAEAFGVVILSHELGHAEDPDLQELSERLERDRLPAREKKSLALRIERNAWKYAYNLLTDSPYAALLQEISYHSLMPYYRACHLPARKKKQTASA